MVIFITALLFSGCQSIDRLATAVQSSAAPVQLPPPSEGQTISSLVTPIISAYTQIATHYPAPKYSIPLENLVVEYEVRQEFPLIGRPFQYFKISDEQRPGSTTYSVLVDITTHAVEEDLAALEAAEAAAHRAKYGKLEVALYDRLQGVRDETVLRVAIWVGGRALYNRDEVYAIIISKFPEAAEAVAGGGKPGEVNDPELALRIQARFEELMAKNTGSQRQAVQAWLATQGYTGQSDNARPILYAELPKSIILQLSLLAGIGQIYLDGVSVEPKARAVTAPITIAGEPLSFETIELREPTKPGYWNDEKAGLLIITSSQGITHVSDAVTVNAYYYTAGTGAQIYSRTFTLSRT
jgi:hypothetical protein